MQRLLNISFSKSNPNWIITGSLAVPNSAVAWVGADSPREPGGPVAVDGAVLHVALFRLSPYPGAQHPAEQGTGRVAVTLTGTLSWFRLKLEMFRKKLGKRTNPSFIIISFVYIHRIDRLIFRCEDLFFAFWAKFKVLMVAFLGFKILNSLAPEA